MVKQMDEKKIYQRLVAALTQRQMPLTVRPQVITPALKKLRSKTKREIKTGKLGNISTMKLMASETATPVYAFSILPVARNTKNIGYKYRDTQESPLAYNPPYGILPQLATLNPEDLVKLADHFSTLKFQYMEHGDYYHAWLFGWRQRIIQRILEGVAKLTVEDI